MTGEDKITTSELVGHLRKGGRLFKVLEHALAAAEFFSTYEKDTEDLKKEVEKLGLDTVTLKKEKEDLTKLLKKKKDELKALEVNVETVREASATEAAKLSQEAKTIVTNMIQKAKEEVTKIDLDKVAQLTSINLLKKEFFKEESRLRKLKEKVDLAKDKIFKDLEF